MAGHWDSDLTANHMGLEILDTAQDEGRALEPITQDEVAFPDQELSDEAALKLVLQDVLLAESYLNSKGLPTSWNATDDLYRAKVTAESWGGGSNKPKSSLSMPVVMEAVESILPQAHMAFFSDPQPFLLQPKGKTTPAAARAMAKIVCWAIKESGFEEETRKSLKSGFLYGNLITKYGWRQEYRAQKTYQRGADGGIERHDDPKEISCPTYEWVDLRNVLVSSDTKCHDPRTAEGITHQFYFTADKLDGMRKDYPNIPSREDLAKLLVIGLVVTEDSLSASKQETWRQDQAARPDQQSSSDPLKQNLEILERWTDDRVITVLQRTIVLRNEPNDDLETKPFLGCAFIDVLNSFYGFGVAKLVADEQSLQTGVMNAGIDVLSLHMNPMFKRKGGIGAQSQVILSAPGKVVNDSGELEVFQIPSVMDEAQSVAMASEARAARRVGANSGPEMPTQAMRTAEGVQAFTAGVQVKLQYFVEQYANLVFIPAIEAFITLCKNHLTPEQINGILTEAEGKAYEGEILEVYNGSYKVDVLSSTKLAGRRAAAQLIIPLMQMVANDPVQQSFTQAGEKFLISELIKQAFDLAGYDIGTLVVPMTEDDQKRAMMNNQAVIKAQAAQQQQAQQQSNALEIVQAKGEVNLATKLITHGHKVATEPVKPLATQGKP